MEKLFAGLICLVMVFSGCKAHHKSKCSECPSFGKNNEKLERTSKI